VSGDGLVKYHQKDTYSSDRLASGKRITVVGHFSYRRGGCVEVWGRDVAKPGALKSGAF
jgi:hypothetical protein